MAELLDINSLLVPLLHIVRQAGDAILQVYRQDELHIQLKDDRSPVTAADFAAQRVFEQRLPSLLDVPVISEESRLTDYAERRQWQRYWLIDPLDGTREFIARNDEFTVNIALIEKGIPVLGVVFAPVQDALYLGVRGKGAWKYTADLPAQPIRSRMLAEQRRQEQPLTALVSHRHGCSATETLLLQLESAGAGEIIRTPVGSSLKFCLLAEGLGDCYFRLGPTCEWDTAAAQVVLEEAGGMVVDRHFQPLRYNHEASILNPHFYALADPDPLWRQWLLPG